MKKSTSGGAGSTWQCFVLLLLWVNSAIAADEFIRPTDRVVSGVIVRASASTSSDKLGLFVPGEQALFLASVPRWYKILHPVHGVGFVSKSWTEIVRDSDDAAIEANTTFDVYVLDVGTGLGIFVRGADFSLVYDAGSRDDKRANRFKSYLETIAPDMTTIDHLIISHPHEDHIEMMPELLEDYVVEDIWDSGVPYKSCIYEKVLEHIEAEGAAYHTATHHNERETVLFTANCASTGDSVRLQYGTRMEPGTVPLGNAASMSILHVDASKKSDVNENSVVVRLDLGGVRILLPGDSEGGERKKPSEPPDGDSVEGALIACCSDELSSDVLVLGHHGSMTSSRQAFLNAVGARDYIVSSGPFPYSGVVLPDAEILAAVDAMPNARRWETNIDDDLCRTNPNKVGDTAGTGAGGCDSVHIRIPGASERYEIGQMTAR